MNFGTDSLCSCNSVKFLMTNFSIPLELHNPIANLLLVPQLSSELALHGLCTHQGPAHECSASEEGISMHSSSPCTPYRFVALCQQGTLDGSAGQCSRCAGTGREPAT